MGMNSFSVGQSIVRYFTILFDAILESNIKDDILDELRDFGHIDMDETYFEDTELYTELSVKWSSTKSEDDEEGAVWAIISSVTSNFQ